MRVVTAVLSLLVVALDVRAQFPIGHATPVNGYAPALFAEPLWLSNPSYGYRIRGAPPGGTALIAISPSRQDQVISGLQIYLDVGNLVVMHTAPIDATGGVNLSIPLGSPDDPSLAGLQFYAQAAVTDPANPGALGTTEGLLLEVTLHPLLAFSAWLGALWLVDPVDGTTRSVSGLPPFGLYDIVFANGGRDLFVGTPGGLFLVDTFAAVPTAVSLVPTTGTSLAWDRVHRRLYSLTSQTITVVDGDRASATFGAVIGQVPGASQFESSIAVSADGRLLATVSGTQITRRDSDPASPTYLGILPTAPANFGGPLAAPSPGRVHVSPDGRIVSVPVNYFANSPYGTAVHRYDGVLGAWIDHDPVAAGYQPLSIVTHPFLPSGFEFRPEPDGRGFVARRLGGIFNSGVLLEVDADLTSPASLSLISTSLPSPAATRYTTLTPSGRFLLGHTFNPGDQMTPVTLSLTEVSTGWVTPWVTLPGASLSSAHVAAWR